MTGTAESIVRSMRASIETHEQRLAQLTVVKCFIALNALSAPGNLRILIAMTECDREYAREQGALEATRTHRAMVIAGAMLESGMHTTDDKTESARRAGIGALFSTAMSLLHVIENRAQAVDATAEQLEQDLRSLSDVVTMLQTETSSTH